jgi:hypothetical protein
MIPKFKSGDIVLFKYKEEFLAKFKNIASEDYFHQAKSMNLKIFIINDYVIGRNNNYCVYSLKSNIIFRRFPEECFILLNKFKKLKEIL